MNDDNTSESANSNIEENKNNKFLFQSFENSLLPKTERTKKILKERELRDKKKKQEEEYQAKLREEKNKKLLQQKEQKMKEEMEEEERKKEEEKRKKEELKQMSQIQGSIFALIDSIKESKTKSEVSLVGEKLEDVHMRIIFKNLENNKSIKHFVLNRKKLKDNDVQLLCENLANNNCMEILELEDNFITSNSLESIGKLVEENKTLRVISLEGNNFSGISNDVGIQKLSAAIKKNDTLISLNLNNCKLSKAYGMILWEGIKKNNNIILVELENNNLAINCIQNIQDHLIKNKQTYKSERKKEYKERLSLRKQQLENTNKIKLKSEYNNLVKVIEADNMERMEIKEKLFLEKVAKETEENKRLEKKVEKEANFRAGKKGKRKK